MSYLAVEAAQDYSDGWEWKPLRRVTRTRRETNADSSSRLLALSSDRGVEYRPDDGGRQLPSDETITGYWRVRPNDLVFNPMWAIGGGVAVSTLSGAVSTAYRIYEPGPSIWPRFLHYWLRSETAIEQYRLLVRGITTFDRSVTREDLDGMPIPVPPLATQQAIADYLDRETLRIGVVIAKQNELVRLLNERIDALIKKQIGQSSLVGADAITVAPLKRLLRKVVRLHEDGAPIVTAYRDGEVNARANRRAEGYTLASNDSTYQGVRRGDVVLHGLDGFSGAIGTSQVDGCCSPVYHVCEPLGNNDAAFMSRMLRILALDGYIGAHATSVRERAVDLRNWGLVGAIPVPVVPPEEQAVVVDLMKKAMPIKESTMRVALLLRERHQALITAAVTGQLDIQEAA